MDERVQTQSLKARLKKLKAEKDTILMEFADKKELLINGIKDLNTPDEASPSLKHTLKIARAFFKHIRDEYVLKGDNHVEMLDGTSIVTLLTKTMANTVDLLSAPASTDEVDQKLKAVKTALAKKEQEDFEQKQRIAREKFMANQQKRLMGSQDIDGDYDDHYLPE